MAKTHLVASLLRRVMNWQKDRKGREGEQARPGRQSPSLGTDARLLVQPGKHPPQSFLAAADIM